MIGRNDISLSLVFPCYNEEGNVERTTRSALAVCRPLTQDFEIVLVNDGSRDRTAQIADRLAAECPQIRVIHHPRNLGYGAALQSGFRAACKEWVFYSDGDGQFDLSEIDLLLALLDQYDIVSAYRAERHEAGLRRLFSWAWTSLVNRLFNVNFLDIDCAFKIYPRVLFDQIEMRAKGALIDTEILVKARNLGYRIGQIGVQHYPRLAGKSTGAQPRVILRAFRELILLARQIRETNPMLKGARLRQPELQAIEPAVSLTAQNSGVNRVFSN